MRVYPNYWCCISRGIQYRKRIPSLDFLAASLDPENVENIGV
jgi:hypothetical protein